MKMLMTLTMCAILMCMPLVADDVHITIKKTEIAPVIDGDKDKIWEGAEVHDEFNIIEGEPVDDIDCAPSFSVMWDETYLYYYVKVIDDYLNVDETPEDLRNPSGGWGWADDCIELYLDGDNSKDAKWNEDMDAAQQQDKILPMAEAGATWWIEGLWNSSKEEVIERIRQGPPVFD